MNVTIENSSAYERLISGAVWPHTEADFQFAEDILIFLDVEKRFGGDPLSWFYWNFYHSNGKFGAYEDIPEDFRAVITREMGETSASDMDYIKAIHMLALNMGYAVFYYDNKVTHERTICIPELKKGKLHVNGIFRFNERDMKYKLQLTVVAKKLFKRERKYTIANQ